MADTTAPNETPAYWHHIATLRTIVSTSVVAWMLSFALAVTLIGLGWQVYTDGDQKLPLLIALFGQIAQIVQACITSNSPSPLQSGGQRRSDGASVQVPTGDATNVTVQTSETPKDEVAPTT